MIIFYKTSFIRAELAAVYGMDISCGDMFFARLLCMWFPSRCDRYLLITKLKLFFRYE